jgi:amino acid adenylation domain-containing protein
MNTNTLIDAKRLDLSEAYRLSPQQRRLLSLCSDDIEPTSRCIQYAVQVTGPLDYRRLETSVAKLVEQQALLRLRLIESESFSALIQTADFHREDLSGVLMISDTETGDTNASFDGVFQQIRRNHLNIASPSVEFHLILLSENTSILIITGSPLIIDQASAKILLAELIAIYLNDQPLYSKVRTFDYFGYSEYRNDLRQCEQEEILIGIRRWERINLDAARFVSVPHLNSHHKHGLEQRLTIKLPEQLVQSAIRLTNSLNVSVNELFLGFWWLLLARRSNEQELTIAVRSDGRSYPELTNIVGPCESYLPIITNYDPDETLAAAFPRLARCYRDAVAYQDAFYWDKHEKADGANDGPVTLAFGYSYYDGRLNLKSTTVGVTPIHYFANNERFRIALLCTEFNDHLKLEFAFDNEYFTLKQVEQFGENLIQLLENGTRHPDFPIGRLELLSRNERQRLLFGYNETVRHYSIEHCVHNLFEAQVERSPERIAVACGGHRYTFRVLNEHANQLANYLQAQGIASGDLVAVCLERNIELVLAFLGILKAGAAYVPLDPMYPSERISYMLEDSGAKRLITQRSLLDNELASMTQLAFCLDEATKELTAQPIENPPAAYSPDSLAYLIYTSGSTGKPKGVQIGHRSLVNFLLAMQERIELVASDLLLAVTTPCFDIAALEIFLPLVTGAQIEIADWETTVDPGLLCEKLRQTRTTVMQATPATWRLLINSDCKLETLRTILCGGEALGRDLADQLIQRCGNVLNMYGPTEATVWVSANKVSPGDDMPAVGSPIANTQFYVLDTYQHPVPQGVAGELYIGGDALSSGYLNSPDLTAEKFIDNPLPGTPGAKLYRTGDLVVLRDDGTFDFLGRIDHQVKIRGFRIELGEIEHILNQHESIRQAVVVAREDRSLNTNDQQSFAQLVAYFVPEPSRDYTVTELRRHVREYLPEYMIPQRLVELDGFPLTPNGKIDRKALPDPYTIQDTVEPEFVAPRTEAEKCMAAIWSEFIGTENISVTDNFFELGGHSLMAIQAIVRIKRELGVELQVGSLALNTLEQLTDGVDIAAKSAAPRVGHAASPVNAGLLGVLSRLFSSKL